MAKKHLEHFRAAVTPRERLPNGSDQPKPWQVRCLDEATALIVSMWLDLPEVCRDVIADIYHRPASEIRPWQGGVIVEYFSGMEDRR